MLAPLVFACAAAQEQSDEQQFQTFFSQFKANNVARIANAIRFPFYVYASPHSRLDFITDKDQSVNVFTEHVRRQILASRPDDFVTYPTRTEIGEDKPDFAVIPENATVVELDIINQRDGSAVRFMFARAGAGYRLFCLVQ